MPILRLFAAAREAAGVARADIPGATVAEMLDHARGRYGERFSAVLARSRVWVNGEPASADTVVHGHDVVAVLPPVSGGAGDEPPAPRPARGVAVATRPRPDPASTGRGVPGRPAPSAGHPIPPPKGPPQTGPPRTGPPHTGAAPGAGPRRAPFGDGRPETGVLSALGGSPGSGAGGPGGSNGGAPLSSGFGAIAAPPAPPAPSTTLRAPARAPAPPPRSSAPAGLTGWKSTLRGLAVTYDSTRPHGRIGLLWAIVTVAVTVRGEQWLAGWLVLNAFVGGSQAAACRRSLDQRPPPALAAILAAAAPVAALYGVRHVVGLVGAAAVLALLTATLGHGRHAHDIAVALAIGTVVGAAAAAPVVTRDLGIAPTLFLLACAATYDASAYLVGTGASSAWEGPVAGIVALIPVTLIAAIILSPPFPSGTPLALGMVAGVLAPLGPLAGTALVGSREADAPGLRRLDSLILLGPVWAWWATTLLR